MDKKEDFKIMELCWAKIKGFPWWPALIRDIKYSNNEKYYNIGYICESLGSDLDSSSLKKWQENYDEFKQGWTNPKDKKSLKQNDFDCSLAMADKISEGKLTPEDHDNYILKYKTKKERHSLYNLHEFIKEIEAEKEKKEKEEEQRINKEKKEAKVNEDNKEKKIKSAKKKFIGRKRKENKVIEIIDDENKSENVKESNEIKGVEIEMSKKDLNKTDDLVKNLTNNLDEIVIKTEKYQKYFEKECKDKNISYFDDKNVKTKIELVKYIQIMNDVFDTPIKLEKEIADDIKEKEVEKEKEKITKNIY